MTPILEFHQIAKNYGANPVLSGVTLTIEPGAFMVVYGLPSTGKSVLMRLLMGLEQPDRGQIILRGHDVTAVSAAERDIGYVPQSFALYPHLSVHDNIAYPLTLAGMKSGAQEPVVHRAAEMLNIVDLLAKRPDQLSGGQKQRVAIARGIAKQTDLFVLDDPLAGLDYKLREQLVDDLKALQQRSGATFLYTTSDPLEAMALADQLAVLDGGQIVESGPPEQLYRRPAQARTMALVGFPGANFLPGALHEEAGTPRCQTSLFDVPVELGAHAPDITIAGGEVMVGIRPEDLLLDGGSSAGRLHFDARIVLREDLGGEELVYLDASGVALTTVVRDHGGARAADDLDERISVAVRPESLLLFSGGGATGRRFVGHGLMEPAARVPVSVGGTHEDG